MSELESGWTDWRFNWRESVREWEQKSDCGSRRWWLVECWFSVGLVLSGVWWLLGSSGMLFYTDADAVSRRTLRLRPTYVTRHEDYSGGGKSSRSSSSSVGRGGGGGGAALLLSTVTCPMHPLLSPLLIHIYLATLSPSYFVVIFPSLPSSLLWERCSLCYLLLIIMLASFNSADQYRQRVLMLLLVTVCVRHLRECSCCQGERERGNERASMAVEEPARKSYCDCEQNSSTLAADRAAFHSRRFIHLPGARADTMAPTMLTVHRCTGEATVATVQHQLHTWHPSHRVHPLLSGGFSLPHHLSALW